jgi:uncharacterized protein (TIGR03790 family)
MTSGRRQIAWFGWSLMLACLAGRGLQGGAIGGEAVVIYNLGVTESRTLAEQYAVLRHVPTNQVLGLELPLTEVMSRNEFAQQLQAPLVRWLTERRLVVLDTAKAAGAKTTGEAPPSAITEASVRYLVLCYGVPLRIAEDASLKEADTDNLRPELRRNEAAVDSELAALPRHLLRARWTGPLTNPTYGATNAALLHPTNGLFLVGRLDGPSPPVARGLVTKALQAEAEGLWGRAYFDLRGLTNGTYKLGDDWLAGAAEVSRRLGFETIVDRRPETFRAWFPLSHVAFYAGWYDGEVSGPFALPAVEFMPGAFAYHLHSFSAATIRSETRHWVGPLLARGATAALGCVAEPYLEGTPDLSVFFARLIYHGMSFGEAAYACQNSVSWQTTVVGDPLYRPFGRPPQQQHEDLTARGSALIEWSHLRVVNLNLAMNAPVADLVNYLRELPLTLQSAVLAEKLADLSYDRARFEDAIEWYGRALNLTASEPQRVRLFLVLARTLSLYQRKQEALELYQEFLKRYPDYGDRVTVCRRVLSVAEDLGRADEAEHWRKEIERLENPAR